MNAKSKHNRFFFKKQKQAFAFQFHPMQDNFTGRGRGREGRVVVGREVAAEGGWFTEDGWRRGCGGGVGGCRMEEKSSSLILFHFKTTSVEPYHWFSFSHFSPLFSSFLSFLFLPTPPPPPLCHVFGVIKYSRQNNDTMNGYGLIINKLADYMWWANVFQLNLKWRQRKTGTTSCQLKAGYSEIQHSIKC